MKKLHLSLAAVLVLSTSFYFVSCKKEAAALLVPAVQKIREAANSEWKESNKSMLEINVSLSQKIKDEYENYATDSNIVVSCRVKFKDQAEERLLPYAIPGLGRTKYYFYTLSGGKLKIHFINTQVTDFSIGGTGSALPLESV